MLLAHHVSPSVVERAGCGICPPCAPGTGRRRVPAALLDLVRGRAIPGRPSGLGLRFGQDILVQNTLTTTEAWHPADATDRAPSGDRSRGADAAHGTLAPPQTACQIELTGRVRTP